MPNNCVILCKKPVVRKAPGVQCGIEQWLFYHFACEKLTEKEIDKIEKWDIVFACEPYVKRKNLLGFSKEVFQWARVRVK
jgi:hypothetical protein